MKWFKETAWPWVKLHWKKLVFAFGAALVLLKARVEVIDALEDADARAVAEKARREKALAAEAITLDLEIKELTQVADESRTELEEEHADVVEDLQENPDALTERMLKAGRQ